MATLRGEPFANERRTAVRRSPRFATPAARLAAVEKRRRRAAARALPPPGEASPTTAEALRKTDCNPCAIGAPPIRLCVPKRGCQPGVHAPVSWSSIAWLREFWAMVRRRCGRPRVTDVPAAPLARHDHACRTASGRRSVRSRPRPDARQRIVSATELRTGRVPRRYLGARGRDDARAANAPRSARRRQRLTPSRSEGVNRVTPKRRKPRCSAVREALCRTRTGDPFLTMRSSG